MACHLRVSWLQGQEKEMLTVSLWTSLLGLTEPLFRASVLVPSIFVQSGFADGI